MPSRKPGPDSRYTKVTTESKHRIVAASFGEVGMLKTSFWLGAPSPIVIQSTDLGTEGVADVYLKRLLAETGRTKDIYVIDYNSQTSGVTQDEAIETRTRIEDDFADALTWAKTIVWDKETGIYEIFKYAEFGAPSDNPSNYYGLDQRYKTLINDAKACDINFGLIQGMRDAWVPKVNQRTGAQGAAKTNNRVRRGMREIDELVHINIEHAMEPNEDGENQFVLKVGKSRGPGGRDIQNQTWPYVEFKDFAMLVFPESEESEWL